MQFMLYFEKYMASNVTISNRVSYREKREESSGDLITSAIKKNDSLSKINSKISYYASIKLA